MPKRSEKTTYLMLKTGRKIAAVKNVDTSEILVPVALYPAGILGAMIGGCLIHMVAGKQYLSHTGVAEAWLAEKTRPGKESQLKAEILGVLAELPSKFEQVQPA